MTEPRWHKSTYSATQTNCVEVREGDEATHVRDTKHRAGGMLTFPASAWHRFVGTAERH